MVEVDLGKVRPEETNVQELIDQSFLENMNGAKIMQDAEGKWGLLTPGADTVTPFSSGSGGGGNFEIIACLNTSSSSTYVSISTNNVTQREYKNILFLCSYSRGNKLKNFPDILSISKGAVNTYEIKEMYSQDNFSDNTFCYYKMLFCVGSEKGMVINLNFSLSLKQADSASKNITVWIIGIY